MKKRIAIIGLKGLPAWGGAARSMENVINYLKNDYDFTIYAIESHINGNDKNTVYHQIIFKKSIVFRLNIFFYNIKSLLHCLFRANYDLIHIHHASSGYIVPFLKIRYKVFTTLHGIHQYDQEKYSKISNIILRIFEKITLRFSNIIVSVSKNDVEYCKTKKRNDVIFIPNGINPNESYSYKKKSLDDYLLFAAARIYGLKGCHTFLASLNKMQYKGKAIVIGDLNQDRKYKKEILELAKNLDIDFIELIKDKSILLSYVKNAKFFIFPSLMEAMSNMLLEVVSIKTPAICSNIDANTSIFNEDEVLYFEVNDINDLIKKIIWANNHPVEMQKKAQLAYDKLVKYYSWELISAKYKNLYSSLMSNN